MAFIIVTFNLIVKINLKKKKNYTKTNFFKILKSERKKYWVRLKKLEIFLHVHLFGHRSVSATSGLSGNSRIIENPIETVNVHGGVNNRGSGRTAPRVPTGEGVPGSEDHVSSTRTPSSSSSSTTSCAGMAFL